MTPKHLSTTDIVILCGGKGSRLQSVVDDRPKPMADIHGRPFLQILVDYFAWFGAERFIFCTGYKADVIRDYFSAQDTSLQFVFSEEPTFLGTAGGLLHARSHISGDTFLVTNGDSFCPVNMARFYYFHTARRALMSMIAVKTSDPVDYGSVTFDDGLRFTGFSEKACDRGPAYINAGIYLFSTDLFALIPSDRPWSLEFDLFPKLVHSPSYVLPCTAPCIDIGTPERLEAARHYFTPDMTPVPARS